jgi:hypothetical protein
MDEADLKPLPEFRRDAHFSTAKTYRLLALGELEAVKRGRTTLIVMASYRRYMTELKPFVSRDRNAAKMAEVAGMRRPPGTPRPKRGTRKMRAKAA